MTVKEAFLTVLLVLLAVSWLQPASAQCNLPCTLHGIPNANCTSCQCLGAWTGKDCSVWDDSKSSQEVISQIATLIDKFCQSAPEDMAFKKRAGNLIFKTFLGKGIDLSTGSFKDSYLIAEDYSGGETWTNSYGTTYTRRSGTIFKTYNPMDPETTTVQVYTSMYDFVNSVYGQANLNDFKWQGPALSQPNVAALKETFPQDAVFTVAYSTWPVISEEFQSTPSDQFTALTVFKGLPPDYSTDRRKEIYRTAIKRVGTHVIVGATYGGVIGEFSALSSTIFADYGVSAKSVVSLWAENELGTRTGKVAPSGSYFSEVRTQTNAYSAPDCGNPNNPVYDNTFDSRMKTLPQPFQFKLIDYTTFIPQPLQSNIRAAINAYLNEQFAQIESLNACPACVKGTCDPATKTCKCDSPTIVGSACNQCATGWGGYHCDQPQCNCINGYCSGPYECRCYEGWTGQNCDQQANHFTCDISGDCMEGNGCCTSGVCCQSNCKITSDKFKQICRWAKGPCDIAETCNGFLSDCGIDEFVEDLITPCGTPVGPCGTPTYCTGSGPQCPPVDVTSKAGQSCRPKAGPCDMEEVCTGSSQMCPVNKFMAEGTSCTDPSGVAGICSGLSPNCVPFCNVAKLILWKDPIPTSSMSIPATLRWFLHDGTTYSIKVVIRATGNPDAIIGTYTKSNITPTKQLETEAITINLSSQPVMGSSYEYVVTVMEGDEVRNTKKITAVAGVSGTDKVDSQPDIITCSSDPFIISV